MVHMETIPAACHECWAHRRNVWSVLDRSSLSFHDSKRETRSYAAGEKLYRQGDESAGVYCIESGFCLLSYRDAFGTETVFRLVAAGESIGWRSFFAEHPHQVAAEALSACRACFIPGEAINQLIDRSPKLGRRFLLTLGRDPGPWEALLLRSPLLPAHIRLVHLLLLLRDKCAVRTQGTDGVVLELPLKRKTLAAMIGIRGETLSRAIARITGDRLARFRSRRVTIPSIARLLNAARRDQWPDRDS